MSKQNIKEIDFSNAKVGEWTVISISYHKIKTKNNHIPVWECKCSCGKTGFLDSYRLFGKKSNSCGCKIVRNINNLRKWRERNGAPAAKPEGVSALNHVMASYKASAKNRNLAFELTIEDFKCLIFDNCHYCGSPPRAKLKRKDIISSNFNYNGIDRKDNNVGYILSNSLPCCSECNYLKSDMDYEAFVSLVFKIRRHLRKHRKADKCEEITAQKS